MRHIAETEKYLLSVLLQYPEKIIDFAENYFLSEEGKTLFDIINYLVENNIGIEDSQIFMNDADDILSPELIKIIRDYEANPEHFKLYYGKLKAEYGKYQIKNYILKDLTLLSTSKEDLNVESLVGLSEKLTSNLQLILSENTKVVNLEEAFNIYKKDLDDRSKIYKYSFGCFHLDNYTTMQAKGGDITTIFGATGGGKSAFTLHLVNCCINRQIPCVYDSLEMGGIATIDRMLVNRSGIPMYKLYPKNGESIDDYVYEEFEKVRRDILKSKKFMFIEDPSQRIMDIERIVKEAKRKFKTDWLIFFADLYSMFKDSGSTPQEIEEGMNRLHEIVKRLNIHFVAIIQANREHEGYRPRDLQDLDKFRPTLKNIKNSGAYAERSRIVLGTFRPKYYAERYFGGNPSFEEELNAMDDIMEISKLKENQGKVGRISYLFKPECFKFYPYLKEREEKSV